MTFTGDLTYAWKGDKQVQGTATSSPREVAVRLRERYTTRGDPVTTDHLWRMLLDMLPAGVCVKWRSVGYAGIISSRHRLLLTVTGEGEVNTTLVDAIAILSLRGLLIPVGLAQMEYGERLEVLRLASARNEECLAVFRAELVGTGASSPVPVPDLE